MAQRSEQRRDGLACLKVDGPFFDLDDDVGIELAVEIGEVVDTGAGAIGFQVVPVKMIVVDEAAIEHHATVRLQCAGKDIGSVGRCAAVLRRTDAAFGVGLHGEAAKVRDDGVDLVDFLLPPGDDNGIERVESVEAADRLWTGEIDGEREFDAPWPKSVGDAGKLAEMFGGQEVEVRINIVDVATVDADGGEQACVVARAGEVGADVALVEEDGSAGIATLDGAIEVVPLVHPSDGCGG